MAGGGAEVDGGGCDCIDGVNCGRKVVYETILAINVKKKSISATEHKVTRVGKKKKGKPMLGLC